MTKSTVTTERLKDIASDVAMQGYASEEEQQAMARELLAVREAQSEPAPIAFSENSDADMCRAWAWEQVKKEVTTDSWTISDSCNFYGFYCWGWDMRRQYNEQRPPAVPAGYKLVPVEPTPQMIAATEIDGDEYYFESDEAAETWMANKFKAMLAAAPTPTKAEVQQISPIKPVLFANDYDLKNGWADHADTVTEMRQGYTVPLYAAPLLLDEIKDHKFNSGDKADDYHAGYQSGWNEYRYAIISAMNSAENGDVSKD
ncbi:hypothetical protein H8I91_09515 [Serratia fonticola]|uniref:hypothetical protein n=1 Tax=Serratia fonticola TaxID=47917 RepID=UPI00164967D5|nr:hypothetical protein [Serratia fonticola]MBC3250500.1 hypothetical protein [Serratia fonticola]